MIEYKLEKTFAEFSDGYSVGTHSFTFEVYLYPDMLAGKVLVKYDDDPFLTYCLAAARDLWILL